MDIKVLGIDLGKTVCSLAGLDEAGAVVFRKRLQRHRLLDFLDTLPSCVVAMEACGGADLPLNFHPAGTGALWVDTPTGAGGATDRCAELSGSAARLSVALNRSSANALGVR